MSDIAFEKRLKRRIIGRQHTFFVVCSPGLKSLCKKEMTGLFPGNDSITETTGGIEFSGKLSDCYRANLYLRSASRVLMRVDSFKASRFELFEKKMNAVDWELFLPSACRIKTRVSIKKSRLYHSEAVAQRALNCLNNRTGRCMPETTDHHSPDEQTLFIRGHDDVFDLSLDTTGQGLYKRGIKTNVITAPIRENLAFAILTFAGFQKEDVLIDPMCGSGTFSLEAAMIQSNIPAGFFRKFAFESWPGFKRNHFEHLKKTAATFFCQPDYPGIYASDIDPEAIRSLENNIKGTPFLNNIHTAHMNFFDLKPPEISPRKGVILLNPPYGKRLTENGGIQNFYQEIGTKLRTDFKGFRYGIVFPARHLIQHFGLPVDIRPLFHGGLDIFAGTGTI